MLDKKEFPILEFDEDIEGIISPFNNAKIVLPNRLIITFFKDVINQLLKENLIEEYELIKGENEVIVYKYKDCDTLLMHGIIGGPACGGFLEDLIGCGVTKVMFCGGGGVLNKEITVGKFIVVDGAIRDEGMSYHYIKPSRIIKTNQEVKQKIMHYLDTHKINYLDGITWTTDAFYRETRDRIQLRKEEGAVIVEMEQAGLIAVTQFRKVDYGAIIYGGDDVSGYDWDNRGWTSRFEIRYNLVSICKELVETF